ncbi:T9SS type A sorting domain-containing protein [Gelidibacter japonicus]|uniref:T9SS type A sorting domain-containing protein n=1 Tax=Gelidibacter japonicus TaxID=1962232 RepID=UPI0020202FDC|nr:T9SS type A sorting domain-containing protein [Gelidibacter japonicus]MCL8006895.1 T9SS type A sorting domain-containing protein [Gelidibacter japonicus]
MKKITQNILIALVFVAGVSQTSAQTINLTGLPGADLIFYEDMRYLHNSGFSGYVVTETTVTEPVTNNAYIPVNGLEAGELGYERPAQNYPAGSAVNNRSAKLNGNSDTVNYDIDVWFVVNSIDLSGYDAGSKFFTFSTVSKHRKDGGTNIDNDTTIWYTTDFPTGGDPTAAIWTEITASPIGASAAMGADEQWTTQSVDLSSINCGTQFAIAIRRQSSANGPAGGAYDYDTNRNGSWWLSDLTYTGSTSPLSISDKELSESLIVYPNPSNGLLNIKSNANVTIKSVALVDVIGKEVFRQMNSKPIDVSHLSKGMYVLTVESQEGIVTNKKVLIK